MSPEVVEHAVCKERTPESVVKLSLDDAHICGNLDCRTVSNCADKCPGCTSQTHTLANIVENPTNALAHVIARGAAITYIDSFTASFLEDDVRWHDLNTEMEPNEECDVHNAEQYLDAIGVLIRHPQKSTLVRWE